MPDARQTDPHAGAGDMRLPEPLRAGVLRHLDHLRTRYEARGWGGRTGFGSRPAVLVIDLARFWTEPAHQMGSEMDPVVESTARILAEARARSVPVLFSTAAWGDPADPRGPQTRKLTLRVDPEDLSVFDIDPRLAPRPNEKVFRKSYASCFKGTNLHEMLAALRVDTLIITGVSTSHCVYATCRDGADSYHLIVARQAVGDRCELFHEVNLMDIDLELGDVMPVGEVLDGLRAVTGGSAG
ncbi:MAG: isochorismatase family protein [Spirochaetaceae bacterium]|nr:isochorismatase family protein [Spirochaetaceae bacterium]